MIIYFSIIVEKIEEFDLYRKSQKCDDDKTSLIKSCFKNSKLSKSDIVGFACDLHLAGIDTVRNINFLAFKILLLFVRILPYSPMYQPRKKIPFTVSQN